MEKVIKWKDNPCGEWYGETGLLELQWAAPGLIVKFKQFDADYAWLVVFENYQALKVHSEECGAGPDIDISTDIGPGPLFEVQNSSWLAELNSEPDTITAQSNHYVIITYDEVIEVIARAPSFKRIKVDIDFVN